MGLGTAFPCSLSVRQLLQFTVNGNLEYSFILSFGWKQLSKSCVQGGLGNRKKHIGLQAPRTNTLVPLEGG